MSRYVCHNRANFPRWSPLSNNEFCVTTVYVIYVLLVTDIMTEQVEMRERLAFTNKEVCYHWRDKVLMQHRDPVVNKGELPINNYLSFRKIICLKIVSFCVKAIVCSAVAQW